MKHGEVLFGDQSRQPQGAQETIICDPSAGCYYADGKRKFLSIDEREANARLVAAAPELLEALKHLRRAHTAPSHFDTQEESIAAAFTAIAKAEGRA